MGKKNKSFLESLISLLLFPVKLALKLCFKIIKWIIFAPLRMLSSFLILAAIIAIAILYFV